MIRISYGADCFVRPRELNGINIFMFNKFACINISMCVFFLTRAYHIFCFIIDNEYVIIYFVK